jgi:tetratricopeptide (TPR) repeat protein
MGQYEEAIEGYLSIIEYDAYHHSYILYNLALAYYDIGDTKNAGKWFQKGIDRNVFHAIFKLAQGRMINIEDEIMKRCGDADNVQKKYAHQYDDACEDMSWSWYNLWLGTNNLPEKIDFLEQVYSDKSKYRSNVIPFPKR